MYIKHQEALLAFMFKYNEMGRAKKKELVKELRCRVDQHKTSFPDTGFLQRPFWINDIDLKCLAIDWGVNIFVVSTEQITVTVIKYLFSVSAPGYVSVNLGDMGMPDQARGECVVCDHDIVLIFNGIHYNVLTWPLSPDGDIDADEHVRGHFENDFND